MRDAVVALAWCLGSFLLIASMVLLVRWAKRGGRATQAAAGVLLIFGLGLAPDVERQRIEDAREEKGKKGGQSGDPPDPEI